jgi:hypothetical protein
VGRRGVPGHRSAAASINVFEKGTTCRLARARPLEPSHATALCLVEESCSCRAGMICCALRMDSSVLDRGHRPLFL